MAERSDMPELVAPRRVFKRKRNKGLILALKIVLPLISVGCVGWIVYWSHVAPRVTVTDVSEMVKGTEKPQTTTDVTVKQVQYNGVDSRNRPFSITAQSASQPQALAPAPAPAADPDLEGTEKAPAPAPAETAKEDEAVVNLKQLVADMTLTDGAWVAVTADDGVYHRDQGRVDLSGNVTLFHDTGLQFQTDAATVDLKNDTASGDQPIEGQNPDGELAAQGFEVRDDGQTVIFTGRAYLKLFPKQSGPNNSEGGGS
jgi:lipopolysaccharide export system protein LptC